MATAGWRMPLPHLTGKATTAAPQLSLTAVRRCPEHTLTFGPVFPPRTPVCVAIRPPAPAAL